MTEKPSPDPARIASAHAPESPSRRRWLRAAWFGAAGAAVAAAVGALRAGGYDEASIPERSRRALQVLAPWQYIVVRAMARRIVAPDRDDRSVPSADDLDVAGFVDGYLVGMRAGLRRDFVRLIGLVEHVMPFWAGHVARFSSLGPDAQDDVLRALESSRVDELRAGFDGIKSLVMMGYYADPRTWRIIGYPGPLVDRPEGGW